MRILFFFILFQACAHKKFQSGPNDFFPNGTYVHHVTLHIKEQDISKTFNGVWIKKPNEQQLVALSPAYTTLLKITDNDQGVQIDFHNDDLVKHKKNILKIFELVKQVFQIQKDQLDNKNQIAIHDIKFTLSPDVIDGENSKIKLKIKIDKYENN